MRRMYSKPQLLEAVESESKLNGIKVFEDIVDEEGHKRFDKGEVNLNNGLPAGITKSFGKWTLSGTHLLIVLAGDIANTTVISSGTILSIIEIPEWIYDKITALYGTVVVPYINMPLYNNDGTYQTFNCRLFKSGTRGKIQIGTEGLTLSKDRYFRIIFDLLID